MFIQFFYLFLKYIIDNAFILDNTQNKKSVSLSYTLGCVYYFKKRVALNRTLDYAQK